MGYRKIGPNQARRLVTASVQKFRKQCGMPRIKEKKRNCLKCEKGFWSAGPSNRLCNSCGTWANGLDNTQVVSTNRFIS